MKKFVLAFTFVLVGCSQQAKFADSSSKQEEILLIHSTKEQNDSRFYAFQQKCISEIEKINDNSQANPQKDWIKTLSAEGEQYFAPNWSFFKEKYGKYLSSAYNDWLKHLDETERIVDDAALLIEPDKLRTYVIYLENFIDQNLNFIAIPNVKERLKWYLDIYLNGLDNSPIYDHQTHIISPKFKISYERFLSENKNSKYFRIVQERNK